jgi:hypothetical protein
MTRRFTFRIFSNVFKTANVYTSVLAINPRQRTRPLPTPTPRGAGLSFLRHRKIYQFDGLKRKLNCSFSSLTDHRSDESSTGYSFMSCSPAELMSPSPAPNGFSLNRAAVKSSAANRNCHYFSLSQPKCPYHVGHHTHLDLVVALIPTLVTGRNYRRGSTCSYLSGLPSGIGR